MKWNGFMFPFPSIHKKNQILLISSSGANHVVHMKGHHISQCHAHTNNQIQRFKYSGSFSPDILLLLNVNVFLNISVSLIHWDIDRFYDIFSPDFLLLLNVNVFLNISVSLIHWDIDKFYDIFSPEFLLLLNVNVFLNISVSLTHWDSDRFYDIFSQKFLLLLNVKVIGVTSLFNC
jgi:uncharacterized ubiquitin-like protein YukD